MNTKKKAKRAPRGAHRSVAPLPAGEPEDVTMAAARKLPMFGPGIPIPMSLPVEPAYLELYSLHVLSPLEVTSMEKRLGRKKPDGVLWVKRIPQPKKEASDGR